MATVNPDRKPVSYEGLAVGMVRAPVALTGDLYAKPSDCGQLFTNKGTAALVTVYLPPIADVPAGWWIEVFSADNDGIKVQAPSGKLVTYNNAAATSVAVSTTGTNIGAYIKVVFDGALYLAIVHNGGLAEAASSVTVA